MLKAVDGSVPNRTRSVGASGHERTGLTRENRFQDIDLEYEEEEDNGVSRIIDGDDLVMIIDNKDNKDAILVRGVKNLTYISPYIKPNRYHF